MLKSELENLINCSESLLRATSFQWHENAWLNDTTKNDSAVQKTPGTMREHHNV